MEPGRWARVKHAFDELLGQPLEARDAWLSAHEPDAGIREEVCSLLDARAESELESLPPGTRLGAYEIVRHLAEGGMGSGSRGGGRDRRRPGRAGSRRCRDDLPGASGRSRAHPR